MIENRSRFALPRHFIRAVGRLRAPALALALVTTSVPAAAGQEPQAAQPERPVLELSLHQAIEMALRHNLQVQINSYTPDLQEEQIMASRARFDPTIRFDVPASYNRNIQQGANQLSGASVLASNTLRGGFSFNHLLEYGTNWSVNWNSSRAATNSSFSTFNPQFNSSVSLNVTQPLLRNFGKEVNRQQIITANYNFESSREAFRQQVQTIVFQTYQAYWELVFAERNVQVQQLGLDLATEQLERNRVQVEIGTLAPIETIQAEQQVASRQLTMIQTQVAVRDREDDLKRLINVEASSPHGWDVDIVPTDEPPTEVAPIDVDAAIAVAVDADPLLRQRRIQLQSQALAVRTARNVLLPQLDFTGSITLQGQGGDRIVSQGLGSGAVLEVQEGGFGDALRNVFSADFRNWSIGLSLTFPLSNWAARAQHAQAIINERSTSTQIADREQQLRVDVMKAARQVQSGAEQVAQAKTASELASRQLEAEQRKFAVGSTTNFQVLDFQRQLSDAQSQELRAIINLANAIAQLELAKGTMLESLGFGIAMAGVPARTQR